jgi:hypothetical protein
VRVIGVDAWPEASVDGREDAAVTAAVAKLKQTGRIGITFDAGRVILQPASSSLVTAFRKGQGEQWLILHNRSLEKTIAGKVTVDGAVDHAARFDAERDRFVLIPHRMSGKRLELDIDMPPYSLWCVRLTSQTPQIEPNPVYRTAVPVQAEWQIGKATDDAGRDFTPLTSRRILSDWVTWPEMAKYSGTVRYRASIQVDDTNAGLNLGRVEEIAELTVNGRNLGVRLCPPYRWNLQGVLRKGENEVIIDVTNTGYARWRDTFSHGRPSGGLLGPVQLLKP